MVVYFTCDPIFVRVRVWFQIKFLNFAHFVACTTKPLILKFPSSFQLFNFSLDFKLQRNDIFRRNFPTSPGTIQLKWKRRMTSQNFNFSLNFELTLALIRNRLCLTIRNFVICNDCGKCRMAIFKNEKNQIGEWPNSKIGHSLRIWPVRTDSTAKMRFQFFHGHFLDFFIFENGHSPLSTIITNYEITNGQTRSVANQSVNSK